MKRLWILVLVIAVSLIMVGCDDTPKQVGFEKVNTPENLANHSKEFKKGVIKVTEGVHVAVGYALANSILIEGEDGVIIVDTTESAETAAQILAEFRNITSKPVKAIIYTHNHADHIFGAGIFAEGSNPEIIAHDSTAGLVDRAINELRPIVTIRAMRMFGNYLDDEALVNNGVGPFLAVGENYSAQYLRPTQTFSDQLSLEVAGVQIELIHAPGETKDQVIVWLPDKKVMLPGDNIYRAYPNLYTIRGTQYRDPLQWVAAIDKMRTYHPHYLVPSHGRPITGSDTISRVLTNYRDGIQFVYDQTIRGINKGLTPNELVEIIKLPRHLSESPFLQEFYGKIEWGVRTIFDGNLGWYDGNPSQLSPLGPKSRAQRYVKLAGGAGALLGEIKGALDREDDKWVLELTDYLLTLNPDNEEAKALRVAALTRLGEREGNPNARHYYLTRAVEIRDGFSVGNNVKITSEILRGFSTRGFFRMLVTNLIPGKSIDKDIKVGFIFPDVNEKWTVHVRKGVAELQPFLMEDLAIKASMNSQVWKEMLSKVRNPVITVAGSDVQIEGSSIDFIAFLSLFKE